METGLIPRLRVVDLGIHQVGPITLAIPVGTCLGLAGPSGAGKTLFLRALADLEPHTGSVFLDGVEQARITGPAWRRQVALLPAESQWWNETVGNHFLRADADGFDRLGLAPEMLAWPVSRLSSGERQRLALLRLLENQPGLLLLDEPTANLDPENVARVEALVGDYRERTGAAVLWVGHQQEQLRRVAGRMVTLEAGRLRSPEGQR